MDSPVNRFSGEQMILASAASDDLRHVLRGVIEATAAGGRPRYPPATGHALARAILTRNYARALLELCHLVGAAERIDRRHGYAGVFWAVTPALSASFQARFQAGAAGAPMVAGLAVNGREIFVAHGRESFAISYARMPFLAALLDFMITALGFRAVDHLLAPVVDQVPGAVPQTANALARAIYGYLRDHLPPPQENRKRYTLLAFLKQRTGAHFTAADIDDAADSTFGPDRRGTAGTIVCTAALWAVSSAYGSFWKSAKDGWKWNTPAPGSANGGSPATSRRRRTRQACWTSAVPSDPRD